LSDNHDKAEWVRAALDKHAGPLTRYAARITGDLDRARDVVQDTFLRLCGEERSRVDNHLAEWLFTVCRHRALDVVRKEHRVQPLDQTEVNAYPSREPGPATEAERRDACGHILRVLDMLPANQQEVIRLKFQDGLSYREISRITRLSVSNVGFLIHTGIKTLRQRLKAEFEVEVKTP